LKQKRLSRELRRLRTPGSLRLRNAATQEIKKIRNENKNGCFKTFLQGLTQKNPLIIPSAKKPRN
jgi:hypothetical protein